jgi:hypothetical protein
MPRNKRARPAVFLGLFFFAVFPALGLGQKDAKKTAVEVSGRVRLVGSGPNTELVITGEDREWHVGAKDRKKLMQLQQQIVRVKGKESFVDLRFANGMPAGRRYMLEDITLLSPGGEKSKRAEAD